jgi:membrane protein
VLATLHRFSGFTTRLVRHLIRMDVVSYASSMAFSFFLSLIPLLVILGYVLGSVLRNRGVDVFLLPLAPAVPKDVMPLVARELTVLADTDAAPAPLLALGFLWASSSGMHGFVDCIEGILELPKTPYWKKRAMAIVWTLLTLVLVPGLAYLLLQLRGVLPRGAFGTVVSLLLFGVGVCVLTFLYRNTSRGYGYRRVWPGAILAALGWVGVSWAFSFFVRSIANYSAYYGSLAAVAVLLLWCFLSAIVLLVGAAINREIYVLRHPSRIDLEALPETESAGLSQS